MSNTLDIIELAITFGNLPAQLRREIEIAAECDLDIFEEVARAVVKDKHLSAKNLTSIADFLETLEEAVPVGENEEAIESLRAFHAHRECCDANSVRELLISRLKIVQKKEVSVKRLARGSYCVRFLGRQDRSALADALTDLIFDMGLEVDGVEDIEMEELLKGPITLRFPYAAK